MVERLMDLAAEECGLDPVEIRRRNFVDPGDFPYQTKVALAYDSGNYAGAMDRAHEAPVAAVAVCGSCTRKPP